jgi:hypothetical protein
MMKILLIIVFILFALMLPSCSQEPGPTPDISEQPSDEGRSDMYVSINSTFLDLISSGERVTDIHVLELISIPNQRELGGGLLRELPGGIWMRSSEMQKGRILEILMSHDMEFFESLEEREDFLPPHIMLVETDERAALLQTGISPEGFLYVESFQSPKFLDHYDGYYFGVGLILRSRFIVDDSLCLEEIINDIRFDISDERSFGVVYQAKEKMGVLNKLITSELQTMLDGAIYMNSSVVIDIEDGADTVVIIGEIEYRIDTETGIFTRVQSETITKSILEDAMLRFVNSRLILVQ